MADDRLREALRDVWDEWLHRAHGITSSCRHDDEIDAVLAVVDARITQARQDGMNEALDWAASNPGYVDGVIEQERNDPDGITVVKVTRARWETRWIEDPE